MSAIRGSMITPASGPGVCTTCGVLRPSGRRTSMGALLGIILGAGAMFAALWLFAVLAGL